MVRRYIQESFLPAFVLLKIRLGGAAMSKQAYEAGDEKKSRSQTNPRSSGMAVKLFSDKMGFYVGLAIFDPISRLFEHPQRLISPYVKKGQSVADIGCGLGGYTLALAESVGPEGKVYAVDLDQRCIRATEKKAKKAGHQNIESHLSSASDLHFIMNKSVDFVLANGLL